MKRPILCWIAVVWLGTGYLQTSAQTESSSPPRVREVWEKVQDF